jgi:hypothetical protein
MGRAAKERARADGNHVRRAEFEARAVRGKLDPRLSYLAGLSPAALRRLKATEDAALATVVRSFAERFANAKGGEADAAELRAVQARIFAPLTAGVILPEREHNQPNARGFNRIFGEPVFSVFILGEASAADLAELGVITRYEGCEVRTAFLPRSCLRKLERSHAVRFIELARPWFYDLADAVPYAEIDVLHAANPQIDGRNVIVGIIDNVIDFYHRAFRDDVGQTRLLYLWDQNLTPQGSEAGPPVGAGLPGFMPQGGMTYGVEYSGAEIDLEIGSSNLPVVPAYQTVRHAPPDPAVDQLGAMAARHGSMVTGCAAGNGGDGGSAGAAPGSKIIFVSPQAYDSGVLLNADNAAILDACSYIFARAEKEGLPCAVNISLGDNQGPHDGTTAGERLLDDLLSVPGRAITLSAGNSTGVESHAAGSVTGGAIKTLILTYAEDPTDPIGSTPRNSDAVEIWYDGQDSFTVSLTVPTSPQLIIGPVAPGTGTGPVAIGAGVTVTVASFIGDPRNGDNWISIIIAVPPGQTIPLGNWKVALSGTAVINGRFHAWIDRNNRGKSMWASDLEETRLTIGVPGTARLPITVGNHTKAVPPVIWGTSALGPTRDGRIKPDIAAVGRQVSAPSSRNRNGADASQPLHARGTGTSFSAPLVAGACALLFQCRGASATCADLKQILTETAGTSGLVIPSGAFGMGYLRMGAACAAPAPNVDIWMRDDAADSGLEPFTGTVFWATPDIEVLDLARNPVPNPTHAPGKRFNNILRVSVRNRGTQTARNVSVFLYWADPATNIPFPDAWRVSGFYTGGAGALAFSNASNHVVIPLLGGGASLAVEFGWAPPAPGSGLAGDGHFCLLARLEHELDPSNVAAGGFLRVTASNNIGLRNVLVLP